jgi:hypothetical protein
MHCYSRVVGLGGYQQVLTHFAAEFIAHFLAIRESVTQTAENPRVGGSIPPLSTIASIKINNLHQNLFFKIPSYFQHALTISYIFTIKMCLVFSGHIRSITEGGNKESAAGMTLPNADTLRCFLIRFITHPIGLGHWLVNVDKMIAFTETFATTKSVLRRRAPGCSITRSTSRAIISAIKTTSHRTHRLAEHHRPERCPGLTLANLVRHCLCR